MELIVGMMDDFHTFGLCCTITTAFIDNEGAWAFHSYDSSGVSIGPNPQSAVVSLSLVTRLDLVQNCR